MKAKITILGAGNSAGVPAIGNHWGACDPAEPRNRRTRPSIAIRTPQGLVVVDTGPDFREQVNRAGLGRIDAILYTHAHGDHVNGIDELRILSYRQKMNIPVFGTGETLDALQARFAHMFAGSADGLYKPVVRPMMIQPNDFGQTLNIGGVPLRVFEQDHGTCISLGVRLGDFGYSCDMVRLDEAAIETLRGIKVWVADGAGHNSETTIVHASLKQLFEMNERIGAQRVIVTHMPPSMDYRTLQRELPEGFEPGYDGLEIEVEYDSNAAAEARAETNIGPLL